MGQHFQLLQFRSRASDERWKLLLFLFYLENLHDNFSLLVVGVKTVTIHKHS